MQGSKPVVFEPSDSNYMSPPQLRPKPQTMSKPGPNSRASNRRDSLSAFEIQCASPYQLWIGELEQAECHMENLQTYWGAVADDLGLEWQNPANVYRQIWEQEIASASERHEYLLNQIGPDLRLRKRKSDATPEFSYKLRKVKTTPKFPKFENVGTTRTQKRRAQRERAKARQTKAETFSRGKLENFETCSIPQKTFEDQLPSRGVEVLFHSLKDESQIEFGRRVYSSPQGCSEEKENRPLCLSPSIDYSVPSDLTDDFIKVDDSCIEKELGSKHGINEVSASEVFTPNSKLPSSSGIDAMCVWMDVESEGKESKVLQEIKFPSDRKPASSSETSDNGNSLSNFTTERNITSEAFDSVTMSHVVEETATSIYTDLDAVLPRESSVIDLGLSNVHLTMPSENQLTNLPNYESDLNGSRLIESESFMTRARPLASDFMDLDDAKNQTSGKRPQKNTEKSPLQRSPASGAESPGSDAVYLSSRRIINTLPGPEGTTLHIGNVPDIDPSDLQALFQDYNM